MHRHFLSNLLAGLIRLFLFTAAMAQGIKGSSLSELKPLSGLYTNELLHSVRAIYDQKGQLPTKVGLYIADATILWDYFYNASSTSLTLLSPHFLVDMAVEGISSYSIERSLESIVDGARYAFIGSFYRHSLYVKMGYDCIPFGRNDFLVITPRDSVTRFMLDQSTVILGVGANSTSVRHPLKSAFYWCSNRNQPEAYILNGQYENINAISSNGWPTMHYLIGGGIACIQRIKDRQWLFNLYSNTRFQNNYDCRFEWLYNTSSDQSFSNAAWCIELAKHFVGLSMIKEPHELTYVLGYEYGTRDLEPTKSLFTALKLDLYKKRILFVAGLKRNSFRQAFEPLVRMIISI